MTSNDISQASKLREKYKHFRVLVIGRANAGKTTLLKRVCNTDEDPCIYDEENKNLRGIHNVNRAFAFKSSPEFIFHDSPGFEAGGEEELTRVREFIEEHGKATEVEDQLHAIWFCFKLDKARPLHKLEKEFFAEKRSGNVPVIAIFTQFDDLVTQVMKRKLSMGKNRDNAFKLSPYIISAQSEGGLFSTNLKNFTLCEDGIFFVLQWFRNAYDPEGDEVCMWFNLGDEVCMWFNFNWWSNWC
ncbi:hypothetical protein K435DRAFT_789890 [Dendrothele bispora CBS 962.96]|uniref:G domain-containing protein n=1 Tax=Dendrothele bispora (strain CBS 962.96) TaxID=1314807 RepID=A0A4S8MSC6_DENBC|nr:hypothetical protein K435DRAFT_789890 [Dendrothele bispora CBS 962.96]